MRPEALTVAAIDAGNLLPVAEVMRRMYPAAQIVIAADNDHQQDEQANTGRCRRESRLIRGWLGGAAADRP
jgi:putative DNA primase/helicase